MNLHGFFSKKSPPDCKSSEGATKQDLLDTQTAISTALGGVERRITQGLNAIMSAIADFAGKVNTAFDGIAKSVDGIVADIDGLKKKIEELQNSSGTITPADQALLDDIQSKADGIATKLAALDAATENAPTPPA